MFIKSGRKWYTRNGQHSSGAFLMLFCREGRELRACVRHVKLTQIGHFMIGQVKFGPWEFVLSGGFGSDGLPINLSGYTTEKMTPEEVDHFWEQLVSVPQELAEKYWKSESHNGIAASVANDLRKWALANLKALRKIKGLIVKT
jgi:hypothetical protein